MMLSIENLNLIYALCFIRCYYKFIMAMFKWEGMDMITPVELANWEKKDDNEIGWNT